MIPVQHRSVPVPADDVTLHGDLAVPVQARGVVLFAHGSGSSRLSPRNRYVAGEIVAAGLGTLLFDLLTEAEADDRRNVFDIPLLAQRLGEAIDFLRAHPATRDLPIGLFGASTGAAAALGASCEHPEVRAVVSRGGRPDLAGPLLGHVRAATLLIVGGDDYGVIELNEQALARLQCEARLEIVPGATHLFEEPGTLEQAARLAADWFAAHLPAP